MNKDIMKKLRKTNNTNIGEIIMEKIICKKRCDTDEFIVQAEAIIDSSGEYYHLDYEIKDAVCGSCMGEVEVIEVSINS
jgi:hypothetical protein